MVQELMMQDRFRVKRVLGVGEWLEQQFIPYPVSEITAKELEQITMLSTPNKVLAIVELPAPQDITSISLTGLSLFLEDLQDPGNMGTILRTAAWFGVQHIFCSPNTVDPFHPKVIQASMGAFLRIQTHVQSLAACKEQFPKTPIYIADMQGESLFQTSFPSSCMLVIGNEGRGISPEATLLANRSIHIPGTGGAESLNAGVATAIICARYFEQHTA